MNCSHCICKSSNYIAARILSFLFGHTTCKCGHKVPQNVMWLLQEYSHLAEYFINLQPPSQGNLEAVNREKRTCSLIALLIITKVPISLNEEVRMSDPSLWWWWLLWLSTLNFNPQQSTVLDWIELYVLLMMAKFLTWKPCIVGWMKDPVSAL